MAVWVTVLVTTFVSVVVTVDGGDETVAVLMDVTVTELIGTA